MINNELTYYHSIFIEPSKCHGEMSCLRSCPVQAIRVRNGKAKLLDDRCIDCGECLNICNNDAIIPVTNSFNEFSKYKYTIAVPSIALYTQFGRNVHPKTILNALKNIGFDEVADITNACVSVVKALNNYIKNHHGKKPLLSSFCPTCIKLIQIQYPDLISHLIPIISPTELTAREIKKEVSKRYNLKKEEIAVVYITPCPSKMTLISHKIGEFYSDFDGAIPISDIYNILYSNIYKTKKTQNGDESVEHYDISGYGLNYARMDGLITMMDGGKYIPVAGINNVIYVLDDIERGIMKDVDLIELHSCHEGCLGGSMITENVYIARNILYELINQYSEKKLPVGRKDKYENCEVFYKNFYKPLTGSKKETDLHTAIENINVRKEIYSRLPSINCGACGSPSCITFAEDVVNGEVKENDCVFLFNNELKYKLKEKILKILELQNQLSEKCS